MVWTIDQVITCRVGYTTSTAFFFFKKRKTANGGRVGHPPRPALAADGWIEHGRAVQTTEPRDLPAVVCRERCDGRPDTWAHARHTVVPVQLATVRVSVRPRLVVLCTQQYVQPWTSSWSTRPVAGLVWITVAPHSLLGPGGPAARQYLLPLQCYPACTARS